MIVTRRFVFLHLHKSGGSFVNEFLLRFVPDARQLGYHLPRGMIPPESAALPVLGFVRSPWSYYVSWYAFQAARREPNALFRVASAQGRRDFAATIACLLTLGERHDEFEELLRALPESYTNRGLNLPRSALEPLRDRSCGFYSYLYEYMFGAAAGPPRIGRMEELREQLLPMLAATGEPIRREMQSFVAGAGKRNESQHAPYADYYDPQLRDLVAQRDAAIVAGFSYRFGE